MKRKRREVPVSQVLGLLNRVEQALSEPKRPASLAGPVKQRIEALVVEIDALDHNVPPHFAAAVKDLRARLCAKKYELTLPPEE